MFLYTLSSICRGQHKAGGDQPAAFSLPISAQQVVDQQSRQLFLFLIPTHLEYPIDSDQLAPVATCLRFGFPSVGCFLSTTPQKKSKPSWPGGVTSIETLQGALFPSEIGHLGAGPFTPPFSPQSTLTKAADAGGENRGAAGGSTGESPESRRKSWDLSYGWLLASVKMAIHSFTSQSNSDGADLVSLLGRSPTVHLL